MVRRLEKQESTEEEVYFAIEYLLGTIFDFGVSETKLNEGEKNMFSVKAKNLLGLILHYSRVEGEFISNRLESAPFRKRSALQFLFDDFGDVIIEGKSLRKVLQEIGIEEVMKILDLCIEQNKSATKDRKEFAEKYGDNFDLIPFSDDSDLEVQVPEKHREIWFPKDKGV